MQITTEALDMVLGGKKILESIDFSAEDKDFIGIVGPNGSGKSTFLKCIYRVQEPSSGTTYFDGKNLNELSYRESAKKLAVVAQHNFYSFDFSVLEIVLMGRFPYKKMLEQDNHEDYNIAKSALAKVGMEQYAARSFSTLSGGEQQRVILARALAQNTECLILDEPTNHLDIKYQLQIMDIVKKLNVTVIAAIHDLNIAAMYCNKLVVLRDGKIAGFGSPQQILTEEFIYDIFGVRSRIYQRENRRINIMYLSDVD